MIEYRHYDCDCGQFDHRVRLSWMPSLPDEPDYKYIDVDLGFSPLPWRWRLKQAWRLLMGRDSTVSGVVLDDSSVRRLRDDLSAWLGE